MKKENINRANVLVKAIEEIDDILTAFGKKNPNTRQPITFESSLLDIRFQLIGNGNTVGDRLEQKYNGVSSPKSELSEREDYISLVSKITANLKYDYIKALRELKDKYEAEIETL